MKPPGLYVLLVGALALSLASCDHKELCFDHDDHAPRFASAVSIDYAHDWEQPHENLTGWIEDWASLGMGMSYNSLRPGVPEGVRMKVFNVNGTNIETNMPPHGEETYLPPGDNSLLFYNNDTEFIVFNDMGSYREASATTRSRHRPTYSGNPQYIPTYKPMGTSRSEETTVAAPDVLYGHYIDSYIQNRDSRPQQLGFTMRPLVFTYVIRYLFKDGYEYVSLARGALAGMAGSVFLHNGRTSDRAVTVLYDCTLEPWGVQAVVRSFGIPDFPNPSYSRGDHDFGLTLEVMLKNGKILSFHFNITEQMRIQPHGGVISVDGIEVKPGQGSSGGSGFDVDVDGWGEFEDVNIDF